MRIIAVGEPKILQELQEKFPGIREDLLFEKSDFRTDILTKGDLFFDFVSEDRFDLFPLYKDTEGLNVFYGIPKTQLLKLKSRFHDIRCTVAGINSLPTMLNRSMLEVSVPDTSTAEVLRGICGKLETDYEVVSDRTGMVTPRIICMIINEAFYALQEGIATEDDIDLAMRLGTNYPWGPLEWCRKIGINHVYEVLKAVYDDTRDERYKICPFLQTEYLRSLSTSALESA